MQEQRNRRPSVPSSSGVHVYGSGSVNKGAEGAKNLWVRTGCHWDLNICTYNARSLSSDDRMIELEEEISRIKWNIIGLSEVRRKGKGSIILNNTGHTLYTWTSCETSIVRQHQFYDSIRTVKNSNLEEEPDKETASLPNCLRHVCNTPSSTRSTGKTKVSGLTVNTYPT